MRVLLGKVSWIYCLIDIIFFLRVLFNLLIVFVEFVETIGFSLDVLSFSK